MINVNEPVLNLILNVCFFLILGLGVITFVPWKLASGKNRWTLLLPILAILIYATYEFTMPKYWDIRIDLLLLWPVLGLIILVGAIRAFLIRRHNARARRETYVGSPPPRG